MAEAERSPWTRPGFLTAALVITLVVILGAVVGFTALAGNDDPAPRPTTAPSSSPPPPTATHTPREEEGVGEESVCGLNAVELEGTVTAAPDVEWELVGRMAAPTSEQHGPGVVEDDGFRHCFSRTPTGALLAAANIGVMGSDAQLWLPTAERLAVPGPGRDALLENADEYQQLQEQWAADPGRNSVQIAGFRVTAYSGDAATVDIALRASDGVLASQAVELVWLDGDWKVQLGPDGQMTTNIAQLPNLVGYTLWSGA